MFKKVDNLIEVVTELSLATERKEEVLVISLCSRKPYEIGGTYNDSMTSDKPIINISCFCEPLGEFYIIPRKSMTAFTPHSCNTSYSKKESYERDLIRDLNNIKEILQSNESIPDWAVGILETNKQSIEEQLKKLDN